jgi:hypothetical protein
MNTADAAAQFHVTERTIRNRCRTGVLPAERVGRDWHVFEDGDAVRALARLRGSAVPVIRSA